MLESNMGETVRINHHWYFLIKKEAEPDGVVESRSRGNQQLPRHSSYMHVRRRSDMACSLEEVPNGRLMETYFPKDGFHRSECSFDMLVHWQNAMAVSILSMA